MKEFMELEGQQVDTCGNHELWVSGDRYHIICRPFNEAAYDRVNMMLLDDAMFIWKKIVDEEAKEAVKERLKQTKEDAERIAAECVSGQGRLDI